MPVLVWKINWAYYDFFTVCWSSQKECEHLLTLINKETGMVIGDVSNLPMYYCNTCGNDTLDISDLRLTASHHMILDIDN